MMMLTDAQYTGLLLTCTELIGDISLREYSINGKPEMLAVGTGAYLGLEAILVAKLKNNKLAIVNAYWDGFSNLATLLAGLMLGETLTNIQIAGILTISAGLLMLEWENK